MRRGGIVWLVAAGLLALPQTTTAQQVPDTPDTPPIRSAILTVKQQELFERSAFGKTSLARIESELRVLQTENREIEAGLEEEERDLTTRRATLPPAEFRKQAEAFDKKVEGIRAAQDAKSRDVSRQRDADQKRFYELAFPILAQMMRDMGAVALIDQSTVVLSLDRIDVTDAAIVRLDAALAADAPTAPPPDSQTQPEASAPQTP